MDVILLQWAAVYARLSQFWFVALQPSDLMPRLQQWTCSCDPCQPGRNAALEKALEHRSMLEAIAYTRVAPLHGASHLW